jgi:hypothetical protein
MKCEKILLKYFLILDINECEAETKPCSDICENTIGSYVCECNEGRRAKDATTCIGIVTFNYQNDYEHHCVDKVNCYSVTQDEVLGTYFCWR